MKGMTLYVLKKGKYFALSNPTKYVKTKLYESVITRWKKLSAPLYLKKDTHHIEKIQHSIFSTVNNREYFSHPSYTTVKYMSCRFLM